MYYLCTRKPKDSPEVIKLTDMPWKVILTVVVAVAEVLIKNLGDKD